MGRIPMKGDPPSIRQIVEKYGDPIDALARVYFDCQLQADQHDAARKLQEAGEARAMAEKCRGEMAKYGFVPKMVEGVPKAVQPFEEMEPMAEQAPFER